MRLFFEFSYYIAAETVEVRRYSDADRI